MSTSRTREKADGELFKSTGIDDNATSTKVTVSNTGIAVTGGIQASDSINTSAAGVSKWYAPSNSGNPEFYLGASDAERLGIQTVFDGGTQNLNSVSFFTQTASGASNKGLMNFSVDGTTRLQINDAGLAVTGGVALGGTGVANTISDYETGTWTPAWGTASGTQPTIGYSNRYGYYVKIGRLVTLRGGMYLNALTVNGASTSNLLINNLPFANNTPNTTVGINSSAQIGWARARSQLGGYGNGEFGFLGQTGSTGNTGWSWETISVLASNSEIRFTISYETDS